MTDQPDPRHSPREPERDGELERPGEPGEPEQPATTRRVKRVYTGALVLWFLVMVTIPVRGYGGVAAMPPSAWIQTAVTAAIAGGMCYLGWRNNLK